LDGAFLITPEIGRQFNNRIGHVFGGVVVFEDATGLVIGYIPFRFNLEDFPIYQRGDRSFNRSSRHLVVVAYLDGARPSIIFV